MSGCPMRTEIKRHFAGALPPRDERALRNHLPGCDACRDLYGRHVLLARLDPKALPAEERIARGLGLRAAPATVPMRLAVTVAAAAAVALVVSRMPARSTEGFSSRGHVAAQTPTSRLFVYDVPRGAPPSLAGDVVHGGDELAFAYENGAAKRRLAVFGVDEHGHVYWFYPAWTREDDDPVAVPIETGPGRHELPEAVLQRFDGEHLQIHGVFVDDPVSVRQIEALVHDDPQGPIRIVAAVDAAVALSVLP
ncbi:MAG: zf-HC2 domain-containing protein [Polyangiaceae bacterium]